MQTNTLKGITWDHSRGYDPLIACSRRYAELHPVSIQWAKRTLKDFGDASLVTLADQYDLLIIDHPHIGVAVKESCLIPLDEWLPSDRLSEMQTQTRDPSFASYFLNDHQWALPIDTAMQSAVYRSDLLTSSPPQNWRQVQNVQRLGMALCPTDALCTFLTLAAQFDGTKDMHSAKQLIPEQIGIVILVLMKRLKELSHPDSTSWNPIALFDYMSQENDVHYAPFAFGYNNYSRAGFRPNVLTFCDVPSFSKHALAEHQHSALLGGAGIAISAQCKNKQAAVDYAQWICNADIQAGAYAQAQGQPAHAEAWRSDTVNLLTNNFFANTHTTLEKAFVRPQFADWPIFQEYIGDMIHAFLVKPTDPKYVIQHLNSEFKRVISA